MGIVGLLKFSSFKKDVNGVSYFEQLKQGIVHFSSPEFYSNKNHRLTIAQQATEINANNINLRNNKGIASVNLGGQTLQGGVIGIKFPNQIYQKGLSPFSSLNDLNNKIQNEVNKIKKDPSYDLIIYPNKYVCLPGKQITFDKLNLEFLHDETNSTWRFSSFTFIENTDIENKRIKKFFMDKLFYRNGKRGSIALDNSGNIRPWIFIPYNIFKTKMIQGLIGDKISYYGYQNKYPYSITDIVLDPYKLLFAKDESYKSQNEFRIAYGGPNKLYKTKFNENINFNWENTIMYGTSKKELEELEIITGNKTTTE